MNCIKKILSQKSKKEFILALIGIIASVILLLFLFGLILSSDSSISRILNWANPDRYQAVFLSNGQVYFGKIVNVNKDTLVLEDIYYLRASGSLQAGRNESGLEEDDFSLIKLGNEIHGPEDGMKINLAHIMFVEDLKSNSKIIEAISEYKIK